MEEKEKVLKYPLYLPVGAYKMVCVAGPLTADTVFKDGSGYVKDGRVWVFSRKPATDSKYPYFWYKDHKICFGKIRDSIREIFSADHLKSYDPQLIAEMTDPNDKLYDSAVIEDMIAATSSRVPTVRDEDDFLKKTIKHAILQKKINLNRLKSRLDKSYSFSNLYTALENGTKMSVPVFITWANLLGLTFEITVKDDGTDPINPLPMPITYSSEWDRYTTSDGTVIGQRSVYMLDDDDADK